MMNAGDRLGGMMGQSMGGPKVVPVEYPQFIVPGTYTFTVPRTGFYKFVAWGAGGAGLASTSTPWGGNSGSYGEITRLLATGQKVTVIVGEAITGQSGGSTILTFPDGKVATAAGALYSFSSQLTTPATATGFDVNINGSIGGVAGQPGQAGGGSAGGAGGAASGGAGGGAGAPANLPYSGAAGSAGNGLSAGSDTICVGAGAGSGGCNSTTNHPTHPGHGAVLVQYVRTP